MIINNISPLSKHRHCRSIIMELPYTVRFSPAQKAQYIKCLENLVAVLKAPQPKTSLSTENIDMQMSELSATGTGDSHDEDCPFFTPSDLTNLMGEKQSTGKMFHFRFRYVNGLDYIQDWVRFLPHSSAAEIDNSILHRLNRDRVRVPLHQNLFLGLTRIKRNYLMNSNMKSSRTSMSLI